MGVASTTTYAPGNCDDSVQPCEAQSPVWSPDGTKIVFAGALKENLTSCNLQELYIADADMKHVRQLTSVDGPRISEREKSELVQPGMALEHLHKSSYPRWSPDGNWIAFVSYGGIYRVHPDGSGLTLIIRNADYPEWSPDGSMLMYVVITGSPFAMSGPSDRIFVARADGTDSAEVVLDGNGTSKHSYKDLNWAK